MAKTSTFGSECNDGTALSNCISPKLWDVLSGTNTFLIFMCFNSESSMPSAMLYGPNTLVTASNYYSVVRSFGLPAGSLYPLNAECLLAALSGS